jgi:hypothetical protein
MRQRSTRSTSRSEWKDDQRLYRESATAVTRMRGIGDERRKSAAQLFRADTIDRMTDYLPVRAPAKRRYHAVGYYGLERSIAPSPSAQ